MSTFYEVLGVSKFATDAEIKRAFKELAKKYHPDKHPGQLFYEEHFKKINTAYQTLSDPQNRKVYDLRLFYAQNNAQQSPPPPNRPTNPGKQQEHAYRGPKQSNSKYKRPASSKTKTRSAADQKKLNRYYLFIVIGIVALCLFSYWFYHFMNNYTSNMYFVEGLKEELEHNDKSAMNYYMVALGYNKKNAAANEKTGDMYIKLLDDYNQALLLYMRASANFKETKDIRRVGFKKTRTLIRLKHYTEAMYALKELEALPPVTDDDSIDYYRADIFFYQENYKQARSYYSSYLNKHPKSSESIVKIALCQFNEGDIDYALGNLNTAISKFPSRGEAYYYKGQIRLFEEDTLAACQLFGMADSLNLRKAKEALYTYCK